MCVWLLLYPINFTMCYLHIISNLHVLPLFFVIFIYDFKYIPTSNTTCPVLLREEAEKEEMYQLMKDTVRSIAAPRLNTLSLLDEGCSVLILY